MGDPVQNPKNPVGKVPVMFPGRAAEAQGINLIYN